MAKLVAPPAAAAGLPGARPRALLRRAPSAAAAAARRAAAAAAAPRRPAAAAAPRRPAAAAAPARRGPAPATAGGGGEGPGDDRGLEAEPRDLFIPIAVALVSSAAPLVGQSKQKTS
jgi:hypothetical protein